MLSVKLFNWHKIKFLFGLVWFMFYFILSVTLFLSCLWICCSTVLVFVFIFVFVGLNISVVSMFVYIHFYRNYCLFICLLVFVGVCLSVFVFVCFRVCLFLVFCLFQREAFFVNTPVISFRVFRPPSLQMMSRKKKFW